MLAISHGSVSDEHLNENALMPLLIPHCVLLSQACKQSNASFPPVLGKIFCLSSVWKEYSRTGMCLTGLALSAPTIFYQLHHIYISWGCGFGFWLQLLLESGNPSFSTVMLFFGLFTWNLSVGGESFKQKNMMAKKQSPFTSAKKITGLQGKMWWASSLQLPFPTFYCRSSRGLQKPHVPQNMTVPNYKVKGLILHTAIGSVRRKYWGAWASHFQQK